MAYLPFRGLSAWFSCSVNPKVIAKWDRYGGTYSTETIADYLFSDDAQAQDTRRIYSTQREIAVFQTSWILEVLHRKCQVHDVVLGTHLLCPHYLAPFETPNIEKSRDLVSSDINSKKGETKKRRGSHSKDLPSDCDAEKGSRQMQLWADLELKVTRSKMSEAIHVDNVNLEEEIQDFDCSRSEFHVKRLH